MEDTAAITPTRIAQQGPRNLAIAWGDGAEMACACAECVDEWSGQPRLDPAAVPADVCPVRIQPVGRYAIQIEWSDGHASGVYPFRRLRELSEA